MEKINNSQLLYNTSNVYKTFFHDGNCYVLTTEDMQEIYKLDNMAREDDKIILINVNQENSLYDAGFVRNGASKIHLDNLKHIHVQKYVKT